MMHKLKYYIDAFSNLHTAKIKGHKAPHKAVLLLAVIDLVEEGKIYSSSIKLKDNLVEEFKSIWHRYLGTSAIFTPDVCKPFFHLQHECFWRLVDKKDSPFDTKSLYAPKEKKELPKGGYSVNAMKDSFEYAEIDNSLFLFLQNADARAMLRVILISTYLINQPPKSMPTLSKPETCGFDDEDEEEF